MLRNVWKTMKENKFEVDNEINSDLICGICKSLMIKACNAPCGCRFCSDCIEQYLEESDKFCPGTGRFCQIQNINYANDIVLDNVANNRIGEIIVKCPRKDCQFKDALCVIDNHMRTCSKRPISCPFNSIGCGLTEVSNDEIKEHFIENNYCHSKLLIDLINNLRNELGSLRSEMIELKREHKHKFDVIELQSTNQQQKILEMERKEMDNTQEIMMLNEEMAALKNANRSLREEMTEIKQYVEMIKVKSIPQIELINKEMTDVKNDNRLIRKQMETDAESNKEIRQQIEENETKSQQQMNELKQNYQRQQEENKIAEMEKCANEIRLIQTKLEYENFINFGFFNGRIEKLSQQKKLKDIYSKPFYSGPSGYKMCLAVFIRNNGDIAVRFHLMRGESDDKLNWPVKLAVTVDVINPADGNVCHSETIKYSDCPDYAGWRKPINDRNDPIGVYGYNYNNDIIPNNSVAIKNDLLLLKCKIDKL